MVPEVKEEIYLEKAGSGCHSFPRSEHPELPVNSNRPRRKTSHPEGLNNSLVIV
jgi:hypothetical protein